MACRRFLLLLAAPSLFAVVACGGALDGAPATGDSGSNPIADATAAPDATAPADATTPADVTASRDTSADASANHDATASPDGSSPSPGSAVDPACLSADAGLPAYKSPASGTLHGPGVDATFCTSAYVELFSLSAGPPAHFVLDAFNATSDLTNPVDGSDPSLFVDIGIGAAAPGVYPSTGSMSCGDISFIFDLPVPAGLDCSTGTAPNCSPGCSALCTASGDCGPCGPDAPEVAYEASVAEDCIDEDEQSVAGSWTVTLTSIEPYPASSSTDFEDYYVVHGSISGTLTGDADAGAQTAAFSLVF